MLIIIYFLHFIGNYFWNDHISIKIILSSIRHVPELNKSLPFDFGILYILSLLIAVLSLAWILLNSTRVSYIILKFNPLFFSNKVKTTIYILVINCVLCLSVGEKSLVTIIYKDPIISFFNLNKTTRVELTEYDESLRKETFDDSYKTPSFRKKNIILIIVDALRASNLNIYGYHKSTTPFLDSLYKNEMLLKVDFATSTYNYTTKSIESILYGDININNEEKGIRIHDILKKNGYKVNFILSGLHKDWYNLSTYYGNGIDIYFEGIDSKKYDPNNDLGVLENLSKIADFTSSGESFFYLHLMSVHSVGTINQQFKKYSPYSFEYLFENQGDRLKAYTNNYDNGILQADYIIKKIFEILDQKGYLENSTVFITSDHGESLGENNYLGHGYFLNINEISIPFLIYDDSQYSYRNLKYLTQIDIAPTILHRIGIHPPSVWKGRSILNEFEPKLSNHIGNGDYSIIKADSSLFIKYSRKIMKDKGTEYIDFLDENGNRLSRKQDLNDTVLSSLRDAFDSLQ